MTPAPASTGFAARAAAGFGGALLALSLVAAPVGACSGDCASRGAVGVTDLVLAVSIALGESALDRCVAADADGDGRVSVGELVAAVGHALDGCPTVIDQRWEGPVGPCDKPSIIYQIRAHQPIGQEFTPTHPLLAGAEVYLRASAPPYEGSVSMLVHEDTIDGAVLGSATRFATFPPSAAGWQRFLFPTPLPLEPGRRYVIELTAEDAVLMWLTDQGAPPCDPDGYRGGQGILLGQPFDNDAYFRTLAVE
ncbi:hypothetical protein KF840_18650 [bacterium]|nr:hypothetical protein [bacterium]